jgi:two-component system, LytTR family, sensor kinase
MQRKHIILIHTVFWVTMLFLVGLETIPSMGKLDNSIIAVDYIIYIIFFFVIFYSFYFFIKKEHLTRIRALIIFGLLYVIIITIPTGYLYIFLLAKEVFNLNGNAFLLEFTKYCLSFLETSFLFGMSGALMKIALLWYDNVMKQKEMEKQLIAGELALLRSQINPQFLFNTLTNIRTLIEQKPEKAIYSIENLSEIMSYMLYETSAEKVYLEDEIDYINNYLNLQRVRYNADFISFDVTDETNGIMVPPMLLMPFIEYAFTSGDTSPQTPGIKITLEVADNNLSFEVMNYAKENKEEPVSGFNLQSIKRRLDLLFGDNYTLVKESKDNMNLIKLGIKF